ncbi:hypothetical protein V6N13_098820 [Hibiscus sabdariffa]|uniref:Uncharacterized protein n=1 Tax=Hibiscus sabdariffa TaxID=183260 RepID=A0ABR2EF06_9ROSI
MKKITPWDWNLGMKWTLRSWSNATHSAMRGIYVSSLVPEPLGHNKFKVGAGWRCWCNYDISPEIKPLEPPLGLDNSNIGVGSRDGCNDVNSFEIEPPEPPLGYKTLMYGAGLSCEGSYVNSLEIESKEPSSGFNKAREGASLRWGCDAELTGSGKYKPD